jgi:nucleotide-binding universal stress UspA family protein
VFKHVLIPTDGSPLSERAALGAVQLAKSLAARLTAIRVSVPYWVFALNPAKASVSEDTYRNNCEKKGGRPPRSGQASVRGGRCCL